MANYHIIKPSIELHPFIEEFWIQENLEASQNNRPTTVLPTTTIDLILIYADPFVQVNVDRSELLPLTYISGQKTRPVQVAPTGKTGMIIVRFFPWGLAPFFDFSVDEATNVSIDLNLLTCKQSVRELEEQIHEHSTSNERIRRIESFLLQKLNAKRCDPLIVGAVQRMNRVMGNLSISLLAKELNMSRRQFHRRFARTVGTGPKEFAEIVRFQKTLYRRKCGADWPELVTECGFYDQAHLIREMKKYSGFSYRNIFSANPTTLLTKHFNSDRKMTHLYNTVYL